MDPSPADDEAYRLAIRPSDWFADVDFATDVYESPGGAIRSTRRGGASTEADLHERATVPQDESTYRRRLREVFGPGEQEVSRKLAASPQIRQITASWGSRHVKRDAECLFDLVSTQMGKVFDFAPTPLTWTNGRRMDNAIGLFLRGAGWEKVVLSDELLRLQVRHFLEAVVHEQTHRLQHFLTCRLNTPQRPLDPLVRGLVLYWLRHEPERQVIYRRAMAARDAISSRRIYMTIPVEYHAYTAEMEILGRVPD